MPLEFYYGLKLKGKEEMTVMLSPAFKKPSTIVFTADAHLLIFGNFTESSKYSLNSDGFMYATIPMFIFLVFYV